MCSVVKEYHLKKRVIDIEILDNKTSSFIAILYENRDVTADTVGNNILIFDTKFDIVFELKNTRFIYTSIFKWIPFDVPDNVINIGFAAMLSKRVHMMKIDISRVYLIRRLKPRYRY